MKKQKRICALILAALMFLTACGNTSTNDWANGGGLLNLNPTDTSNSAVSNEYSEPAQNMPEQTVPQASEPIVTDPYVSEPAVPDVTEPELTEPEPTEPEVTEPTPTQPEPTEPKPTEPKPTEPQPTEPKPTEPKPTEPPHVHEYVVTTKVEANCTKGGYVVHTCTGCGKSYTDGKVDKLGHSYGEWTEIARDGIDITEQSICSRCGDAKTRETLDYPEGDYSLSIVNGAYITKAQQDACARKIYEITKPWLEADLSDYEKAEAAFLYLRENVTYLQDFDKYTSSHYGALINGQADCWGYSNAFQYLCHALGLKCYVVGRSSSMHKWNIVELDGVCYHVDAQVGYFLLSDNEKGITDENREWEQICPQKTPYGNRTSWW